MADQDGAIIDPSHMDTSVQRDTDDLAERLERGLLDFAVITQTVDLSKYNYQEFPGAVRV